MEVVVISLLFFLGKLYSLCVYQSCWEANDRKKNKSWLYYLFWLPIILSLITLVPQTWQDLPITRIFAFLVAVQLAIAAAGRFDPARPAILWSSLTVILASFVFWHPAWLVVSLICTCSLQYRQASWKLSPGYSNLLGFEFSRSSACSMITALSVTSIFNKTPQDQIILSVVILHQASYYINHALAKNALGKTWYDWMMQNRIEHLIGNAWLRGWTLGISKTKWLSYYHLVAKYRVPLCWAAWFAEVSWLFIFFHSAVPLYLYPMALLFHLIVMLISGLSCWHFILNHICILYLLSSFSLSFASCSLAVAAVISCSLAAALVGIVRINVFKHHRSNDVPSAWHSFADPSDHLMAWWDSPLMRMYSYTVVTTSGKHYFLPVTKLSPYDTFLTDIHTHLMVLNQHKGFDPALEHDKTIARTGVWGLIIDQEDKERLYTSELPTDIKSNAEPWSISSPSHHSAAPLLEHFQSINQCIQNSNSRWRLRWPHFPGEDHAPDRCPLIKEELSIFKMNEPIATVKIWRIKTWSNAKDFTLLDHSLCGELHLNSNYE